MKGKVKIFIDGASRGNPGRSASAIIFCNADGEVIEQLGHYLGETTNNVAEYVALIKALERAQELGLDDIEVLSDSQLLTKQIKGEYTVHNERLKELFIKAQSLIKKIPSFSLRHIPREENFLADKLANAILDEAPE